MEKLEKKKHSHSWNLFTRSKKLIALMSALSGWRPQLLDHLHTTAPKLNAKFGFGDVTLPLYCIIG